MRKRFLGIKKMGAKNKKKTSVRIMCIHFVADKTLLIKINEIK